MTGIDDLPAGEAEREQALSALRRAAEDGRLAPAELDERIERARSARSARELAAVLADLGAAAAPRPYGVMTAAEALAALASVGSRPDAPLVLSGGIQGDKREGTWVVPPFLRADAGIATIRIDCTQARAAAEVVDLEVQAVAGTVVLILPPGWAVNVDGLGKGIGTIKVRVPGVPAPGCPLFIVHGSVGLGTFSARPANRFERWRLRLRERRYGAKALLP